MPTARFRSLVWLVSLCCAPPSAATDVPGGTVSGLWDPAGSPYIILGNIQIPAGETLILAAGTSVDFNGPYRLTVQGVLLAQGTVSDSIRITGQVQWEGIRCENPAVASSLRYCRISNAEAAVSSIAAPLQVGHCRLTDHGTALHLFGVGAVDPPAVEITGCSISDCQQHGIFVVENSNTTIAGNEVTRCALDGSPRGAIQLSNQSAGGENNPEIRDNWIHHNTWQGLTAFDLTGAGNIAPTVEDNTITYNYTGVYLLYTSGLFHRNQIHHNFQAGNPNSGAGVMVYGHTSHPVFTQNTLTGNFTGFYFVEGATANLGDLNNADPTDDGANHIYGNIDESNHTWSVYSNSAADILAENNIWDSDDYGVIAETIFDGHDNPAFGMVDFDPIRSIADVPLVPRESLGRVTGGPNPFRRTTQVRLSLTGSRYDPPPGMRIYDVRGRLVRDLSGRPGSLELTWIWDGCDNAGRVVGPGLYLYRLDASSDEEASGRLIYLH